MKITNKIKNLIKKLPLINKLFTTERISIENHNLLVENHNLLVENQILALITYAKINNKPIFVQVPICNWRDGLFQRPQQLAIAMAKIGCLVIYLEDRIEKNQKKYFTLISDNVYISNNIDILTKINGAIISFYLHSFFYITPFLTQSFAENNKLFCEHVDGFDLVSDDYRIILESRYLSLQENSNCLFLTTSKLLYNDTIASVSEDRVLYSPNGVDVACFRVPINNSYNFPASFKELISTNRKVIGYWGALAFWIWEELLEQLAEERPDYDIVLIGEVFKVNDASFNKLFNMKNVHYVGKVEHKDLVYYGQYFDASIIPFRFGDLAKSTSPVKLFEYFAIGKPVIVTSDLVECTVYDMVYSANSIEDFINQTDKVLSLSAKEKELIKQKYNDYAVQNTWKNRARAIVTKCDDYYAKNKGFIREEDNRKRYL